MSETRWWWLRHARSDAAEGVIVGRSDVGCRPIAAERARRAAARLPEGAVLLCSGLRRTLVTAEALTEGGADLPPPLIEPALVEQDFGEWTGRRWADLADDPVAARFWADPAGAPPGGESFAAVMERVRAAVERLSDAYAGRDIVAVSHAGPITAAVAMALGVAPRAALSIVIEPLSLTRLDRLGGCWRVAGVNWPA